MQSFCVLYKFWLINNLIITKLTLFKYFKGIACPASWHVSFRLASLQKVDHKTYIIDQFSILRELLTSNPDRFHSGWLPCQTFIKLFPKIQNRFYQRKCWNCVHNSSKTCLNSRQIFGGVTIMCPECNYMLFVWDA